MPKVIHFEIHATDPESLIGFYELLLGWRFVKQGPMDYWLIATGGEDEPGIDGGLVRRPVPGPATGSALNAFTCIVRVDSLDETLARADAIGGELALPKMAVPGIGWLAYLKDPDGNVLGLLQPDPGAR